MVVLYGTELSCLSLNAEFYIFHQTSAVRACKQSLTTLQFDASFSRNDVSLRRTKLTTLRGAEYWNHNTSNPQTQGQQHKYARLFSRTNARLEFNRSLRRRAGLYGQWICWTVTSHGDDHDSHAHGHSLQKMTIRDSGLIELIGKTARSKHEIAFRANAIFRVKIKRLHNCQIHYTVVTVELDRIFQYLFFIQISHTSQM